MHLNLKKTVSSLPKSPGIYKFYDSQNRLIYIGKATSLRNRVGSYFTGAHDNKTEQLVSQIAKIKIQSTQNTLEALILEANLIKKNQPKYNIKAKDDKSFSYLLITKKDKFPRIIIVRKTDLKKYSTPKIYGPYTSRKQISVALRILKKIFPFHSGQQKTEKGCLDFQLGYCPGPYAGQISPADYKKNIRNIEMILRGKKNSLLKKLEKEMQEFSQKKAYEKAQKIRNQIFALQHIRDVALLSDDFINDVAIVETPYRASLQWQHRIECYDISNISGAYAVGSMVVFEKNEPKKSDYRKFKIKNIKGIDDIAMMQEILARRFNHNWPHPDLIVLDGGKGHFNMAAELLKKIKLENILILAVAKGPTRKKLDLYFDQNKFDKSAHKNIFPFDLKLIEKIRNEAHRFAISYHRKLRDKEWLK